MYHVLAVIGWLVYLLFMDSIAYYAHATKYCIDYNICAPLKHVYVNLKHYIDSLAVTKHSLWSELANVNK